MLVRPILMRHQQGLQRATAEHQQWHADSIDLQARTFHSTLRGLEAEHMCAGLLLTAKAKHEPPSP